MVSSSRLLHRLSLGRWLLGLVLVMANGSGWAGADSVAGAGERIGRLAERAAVVAHDVVYQGAVLRGLYGPGTAPVDHPCGHTNATAGVAPSSDPCTSPGSPCAGLCITACQPAAGAGPALPFTPAGLPATGLAEARPQRSGWTGTGRSVPPESPSPIV
jgi:hypothetical protein